MHHFVSMICALQLFILASIDTKLDPTRTPPEIIMKYGYPAEEYHAVTEDGYILQMFRIPYSPKSPAAPKKPVAILHHGMGTTSKIWILIGPGKALGFLLADEGYDVWLGNFRGSAFSRNHTSFSVNSKKFWNFTFHEMGVYDIPAMVDFIIKETGVERHYHVGISNGGTAAIVFAASRPDYKNNVKFIIAQAPGVFYKGANPAIHSSLSKTGLELLESLGANELSPPIIGKLSQYLCANNLTRPICEKLFLSLTGNSGYHSLLPEIVAHMGPGISVKMLRHYIQLEESGKFQQFDYGIFNVQKYGQPEPPEYNLKAITTPVSIMYAPNDIFYGSEDASNLCKAISLSGCAEFYRVPVDNFTHFAFAYGNDVKTLVNDVVIEQLKKY